MASLSTPRPGPVVRPPAVAFRIASDARLTKLAAAGSEGAMAAIFERHHQALYRYCASIVGNEHDAADALQNTMMKAMRALPGETRQIALRPWLYRIAHNESISLLRARRPDGDLDAAAHLSDAAAAGAIESGERLRSLAADLRELTERQRSALLMRELGGLEFTEVADALQTSAAAVKQSVYEARCALQAMQEGRAMDCDAVQRTLSDGDRRMLRGMRMRGHLRDCAHCNAFEISLRERPAQLQALLPPLPVAAAAGMLHSILGGGGAGSGGGVATGLVGTAKVTTGLSLAAKAATVVAVSATVAGGAAYAVPALRSDTPKPPPAGAHSVGAGASSATPAASPGALAAGSGVSGQRGVGAGASASDASAAAGAGVAAGDRSALAAGNGSGAGKPAGTPAGRPSGAGKPAGTPAGRPSGAGKPAGTPAGRPSGAGKPAGTPSGRPSGAGKPAGTPAGKPSGAGKPAGAPAASPPAAGTPAGGSSGSAAPAHNGGGAPPAGATAGGTSSAPAGTGPPAGTPASADPHAGTP
jgi:RNA polymerase sigma factor (sigma-70 family)